MVDGTGKLPRMTAEEVLALVNRVRRRLNLDRWVQPEEVDPGFMSRLDAEDRKALKEMVPSYQNPDPMSVVRRAATAARAYQEITAGGVPERDDARAGAKHHREEANRARGYLHQSRSPGKRKKWALRMVDHRNRQAAYERALEQAQ